MALQIRIDQAGKPPGVAGQAREDLATGTAVQLTATGGPFSKYLWTVLWKPIDIIGATRSAAALSSATSNATLLQPIDLAGTYFVEVSVDSGSGLGALLTDVARVTFYAGPTLATDPTQLPRRIPAFQETVEHTVPDGLDLAGNPDGWSREWLRWFALLQRHDSLLPLASTVTTSNDTAATLFQVPIPPNGGAVLATRLAVKMVFPSNPVVNRNLAGGSFFLLAFEAFTVGNPTILTILSVEELSGDNVSGPFIDGQNQVGHGSWIPGSEAFQTSLPGTVFCQVSGANLLVRVRGFTATPPAWVANNPYLLSIGVSGAASAGGLVEITTTSPHGLSTGKAVAIFAVGGVDEANGVGTITVTGPSTFTLDGSVFSTGPYTFFGTVDIPTAIFQHAGHVYIVEEPGTSDPAVGPTSTASGSFMNGSVKLIYLGEVGAVSVTWSARLDLV